MKVQRSIYAFGTQINAKGIIEGLQTTIYRTNFQSWKNQNTGFAVDREILNPPMQGSTILEATSIVTVDAPEKPEKFSPRTRIKTRLDISPDLGSFAMDSMFTRHFCMHNVELSFKHNTLLRASSNSKPQYGLAVMFSGAERATFGDRRFDVNGGKSVLTYNPSVPEDHCFLAGRSARVSYFDIDVDYFNNFFFDNVFDENRALIELKNSVERNQFADHVTAFSNAQARVINDINNCPLQGSLGNLMLEGSLQQLIALQFALPSENQEILCLSPRDKETIFAIKEYLTQNFQEEHSLHTIARRFGINQGKLKKNFKRVVGVPVIEYIYNLRMEHARILLLDGGLNVGEVAPIVGYRHAHHFTAAFKRKFGVSPSRLKN